MHITSALITRLVAMPDSVRNQFIQDNKASIDFIQLNHRLKEMANEAVEKTDPELAEKLLDIKADVSLYEALQRFPAAVQEIQLVSSPMPSKKVVMELCSVQ